MDSAASVFHAKLYTGEDEDSFLCSQLAQSLVFVPVKMVVVRDDSYPNPLLLQPTDPVFRKTVRFIVTILVHTAILFPERLSRRARIFERVQMEIRPHPFRAAGKLLLNR